ncbi:hypothetical protein BVI2075_150059 [Burkholderia vietnamiensis]|nr:hypothetical protein BVI2075_150059 [Burkholderia vietnamiensis]
MQAPSIKDLMYSFRTLKNYNL